MDRDSVANVVSFSGVAAVLMEWQSILTVFLLLSGIILNIIRIRSAVKGKKED